VTNILIVVVVIVIVGRECDALREFDCTPSTPSNTTGPPPHPYHRVCIDVSKVCDGHNDCGRYQDEQDVLCAMHHGMCVYTSLVVTNNNKNNE